MNGTSPEDSHIGSGQHVPHVMASARYVAALDVGTSSVRCVVYDRQLRSRGRCQLDVHVQHPQPGHVEVDPEHLYKLVCQVVREAITDAKLTPEQVTCVGISTQRGSFTTWNRDTGRPYHNIICWNDTRANQLVLAANRSLRLRVPAAGSGLLYLFSRNPTHRAVSKMKFTNKQVTIRLLWCVQNIPELSSDIGRGAALFGTVDTYLLYRLTGGRLHVTDSTNAAATGFFNPYEMTWSGYTRFQVGVPAASMLPQVVPNTYDFGTAEPSAFGAPLPIACVIADQSASLFGSCCFQEGDMVATLGTGTFLDVNLGSWPHADVGDVYPAIGWQIGNELVYMAEASASDTAASVLWGQQAGLYSSVQDTEDLARSVSSTEGVSFVPAAANTVSPLNHAGTSSGFIGVSATTTAAHLTRAILQALCFRLCQLYNSMTSDALVSLRHIRLAGGVAHNSFLCQYAAGLLGVRLERPDDVEMSAIGAASIAGLATGVWTARREVAALRRVQRNFEPDANLKNEYRSDMQEWERAVKRFTKWY